MSRIVLALLLVTAWLDAHAQSSLPPCPENKKAIWTNCVGFYEYDDGVRYVGEFRDGKRNGQGTATGAYGGKYVGEFQNDEFHGQGTVTSADGEKYVGEFRDGKQHGQGTNTWADGRKYVGEFQNGKYHGQGTFTWADGRKSVGEWRGNKRNGHGTYTHADGSKYVGEFQDDRRNGQGIAYAANGTINAAGLWANGELSQAYAIDTNRFPFRASSGIEAREEDPFYDAKAQCRELGFKEKTEKFGRCVLTLSK